MTDIQKKIFTHNLPELCRQGKIAPAPSFLATKVFALVNVVGAHPILEWFAIYIYDDGSRRVLEIRAIEPETYLDVEAPNQLDPENPATFALSAQTEVQYQIPAAVPLEKLPHLLQSACDSVLSGALVPEHAASQGWFKWLDGLCDSAVW